jgi:hypothetical protein
MVRLRSCVLSIALASAAFACSDDPSNSSNVPVEEPISFDTDIHPILQANCGASGCHAQDQPPFQPGHGAADVNLAFMATQQVYNGTPVYERILARTSGNDSRGSMPPACGTGHPGSPGCLTVDQFALIEAWVEQGAKR